MKIRLIITSLLILVGSLKAGAVANKFAAFKQGAKNLGSALAQETPYLRARVAQQNIKNLELLLDYSNFKNAHLNGIALLDSAVELNKRMIQHTPSSLFAYGKYTRFASQELLSKQKYLLEEGLYKVKSLWEKQYKDIHFLLHAEKLLQEALAENAKNYDLFKKIKLNVQVLEKDQKFTALATGVVVFGTLGATMYAVGTGAAAAFYYSYSYVKDALSSKNKPDQKVSVYDKK